jgi:hypothetical protein
MTRFKQIITAAMIAVSLVCVRPAKADLFGADVAVLTQILINAIQQLLQLQQILSNGSDTLSLMREINQGIRDGLGIIQIVNPRFNPGIYGGLDSVDQIVRAIQDLYGQIPQTADTRLQEAQDRSASESIAMNGTLFRFADQADDESKRIIAHAGVVNPQGAAKLTAESIAVLIGVTTQVLRSNSMMLKLMGQNMALQNRKEKLQSAQFKTQYDGLSGALGALPQDPTLSPLEKGE